MAFDTSIHHRRSIKLKGYDYSSKGMYFVTIRVKNGRCVLGEVAQNQVTLSGIGETVRECWQDLSTLFPNVVTEEYAIMPNHVHGIVTILDQLRGEGKAAQFRTGFIHETRLGRGLMNQTRTRKSMPTLPQMSDPRLTLGKIVRAFKAKCTKTAHERGFENFEWLRGYYEHIIRDGTDLDRIREYILENPSNWRSNDNQPKNMWRSRADDGWSALD